MFSRTDGELVGDSVGDLVGVFSRSLVGDFVVGFFEGLHVVGFVEGLFVECEDVSTGLFVLGFFVGD